MIKVGGLSYERPVFNLVGINIEVGRGDLAALIGPNGSGKSLLLEKIADPESEYRGTVTVGHYQSRADTDKFKAQVGYLPQNFSPPKHLTGYELLSMWGSFYYLEPDKTHQRILKLAEEFGCQQELYTLMEKVSPSVIQSIGFISAILAEPPALLLDEPLQHLDYQRQQLVMKKIKEQKEDGRSILLATNDLVLAENLSDYVIIIDQGTILAEGTVAQLAHQAQSKKDLHYAYQELITNRP